MLQEIDIGHAGQNARDAISDLEVAISTAKSDSRITAVKIIHGLGSGRMAAEVRGWAKVDFGGLLMAKITTCLIKMRLK